MSPPVFAPLAAIVALCLSATTVRSLAPQGVLGPRAFRSCIVGSDSEVTLTEFARPKAKLAEGASATVGLDPSYAAASASAAGKTRPPSGACAGRCGPALWPGAHGGHDRRRAAAAAEPGRVSP